MATPTEAQPARVVKVCEACGAEYPKRRGVSAGQFARSRACSRGCSCALGQRNRRWPSVDERFATLVDRSPGHGPQGDCWPWTGYRDDAGYGTFSRDGRAQKAHRVAYELENGPLPDGVNALHRCDWPPCVNPAHIFPGDHDANMADMVAKGRGAAPKGEAHHDAKLTEDQVRAIRSDPRANTEIAKQYGVTKGAIWQIKHRRNWKHIT